MGAVLALAFVPIAFVSFAPPTEPAGAALVSTTVVNPAPSVPTVASEGYLMTTSRGAMLAYGQISLSGSMGTQNLSAPVVSVAATPDGKGYWLAGADGGVFAFGDATFHGSLGAIHLTAPIVGVASTVSGKGYWLTAGDGGVFTFGDAPFYGSMGGVHLSRPIEAIAPSPDGHGYWEVASDGGVFSFGDARFFGSMGGTPLNAPVVAMSGTPDGLGYWEVANDGGIFSFGDAHFVGSMGAKPLNSPIVGLGATIDGGGYWEAAADGGIFAFGDAPFRGSDASAGDLFYPVVSFTAAPGKGSGPDNGTSEGLDRYVTGAEGYDISWPQCGGSLPPRAAITIVGITDGHGMSTNPCFAGEAAWAGANLSIYMNADYFSGSPPAGARNGPRGACALTDPVCLGYNYGWGSAVYAVGAASRLGSFANLWWLDVEAGNNWSSSTGANDAAIQGMVDYLHSQGIVVGIYSTAYQWGEIAGTFQPTVPNWYATGESGNPPFDCTLGFTGGPTWMVQAAWSGSDANVDGDFAC